MIRLAQLVNVCPGDWAKESDARRDSFRERAVWSITQGIVLSEGQVRDEELAEAVRLRKELEIALAEER